MWSTPCSVNRLYDTGERELQILGQPEVGTDLHLAFQRPDALSVLFLVGIRTPAPPSLPGITGDLGLYRSARLWTFPRAVDGAGRADMQLPIPDLPALHGLQMSAQALYRRNDGSLVLTPEIVDPLFR